MADSPPTTGPHQLYAYEPPISLWELIKSYVPEHELQEVKNILGESLVEQSIELHQEVETLLDIWRDYRNETENNLMYHRLPEPPAARDRLIQEIRFFVDSIREKADDAGVFTNIISKHNKNVLDYVFENKTPETAGGGRPTSARSSRDGQETPVIATSPDRFSRICAVSKEVDSLKKNLNFLQLDDVVHHLRQTLMEEVEWLLKDTEFLQKCLEDESSFRADPMMSREPSLADLRQERLKLEKDLLADDVPRALKDMNITTNRPTIMTGARKKTATPPRTPSHGKIGPMKASHQVCTQTANKQCTNESCDLHRNRIGLASGQVQAKASRPERPSSGRSVSPLSDLEIGSRIPSPGDRLLTDSPTHITVRTGPLANSKVVKVGSIPLSHADVKLHTPSPPSSSKPRTARPGSAQKFRQMILDCREGN